MLSKGMGLRGRIALGYGCIVALSVGVGVVGLITFKSLKGSVDALAQNRLPSLKSLLWMEISFGDVALGESELLSAAISPARREEVRRGFGESRSELDRAWKVYEPLPRTPEEKPVWDQFVLAFNRWWQGHEECLRLERSWLASHSDEDYRKLSDQVLVANDKAIETTDALLHQLIAIDENVAKEETEAAKRASSLGQTILIGAVAGALLLSVVLGFFITRGIVRSLRSVVEGLSKGAEQVSSAAGQLSQSSQGLARARASRPPAWRRRRRRCRRSRR